MNDKNDTGMDENSDLTKPKYRSSLSGRDLRASSIGWEISLPIVAGPLVGYLIDKRFDTGVTFTLIFLGLGLAIVRSVCRAHGGALTLAPRDGGGLVATVGLPLAAGSVEQADARSRTRHGTGPLTATS